MNVRRTRLVTGLILLTYLSTHLLNHALGLISLAAMEWGRWWFLLLWRNPIGTAVLYSALLTHLCLAIWALYRAAPLAHAGERAVATNVRSDDSAADDHPRNWHPADARVFRRRRFLHADGFEPMACLSYGWLAPGLSHSHCLDPWLYRLPFLAAIEEMVSAGRAIFSCAMALLLPVCGVLGFVDGGREISNQIARQPEWLDSFLTAARVPPRSQRDVLYQIYDGVLITFGAAIVLALLARVARSLVERRSRIRITYPNGREVQVPRHFSILEASRLANIPHASVCGGRGRCSTCRVRVSHGAASLPPPSAGELRVLQRVGAAPNVRLACQLRPTANLAVTPLLPASAQASDGYGQPAYLTGQERMIAVMFADIRSFTGIAETKLPYDLVFFLNSYFESVGAAIVSERWHDR